MTSRQRTGRLDPARPLPARMCCETFARVPDRLMHDAELSVTGRLVGLDVAALARDAGHTFGTNELLQARLGLGRNAITRALAELESAGYLYRVLRGDAEGLDALRRAGYPDPWGVGGASGTRCLVLSWALPRLGLSLRGGAPGRIPRRAARRTPRVAEGGAL